jgi:hypothetical protein
LIFPINIEYKKIKDYLRYIPDFYKEILQKKSLNSIIIIIFNNLRNTEHNRQQGLRSGKYQGGHRSSIFRILSLHFRLVNSKCNEN